MILLGLCSLPLFGLIGGGSVIAGALSSHKRKQDTKLSDTKPSLDLLIPAHNEEKRIETTLKSIHSALPCFAYPPRILITLDACTDQTEAVINRWTQKLKIELKSVNFQSKWKTLQSLVDDSEADWVLLLDSGIHFKPTFISNLLRHAQNQNLVAYSPSYRIEATSKLNSLFWNFEKNLKKIENRAGGPISVHGASIAYRSKPLKGTLQKIKTYSDNDFSNDDIIIPLALRKYYPTQSIFYSTNDQILDQEDDQSIVFSTQFNRRKRMVIGNLQWIRWLKLTKNSSAILYLLSLRRALRPFWVEVLIIFFIGARVEFGEIGYLSLLPIVFFPQAALASLYAPWAWLNKLDLKKSAWK